jgi:iron complex transport system substrate-binding protein
LKIFVFLIFAISTLLAEHRIVTLSPAVNEIVFALGAGKSVVGTTKYANFPEEAKRLPRVGGYHDASLEKIVALAPTLVITEASGIETTRKLEKLGIKTLSINIDSLASIKSAVTQIGAHVGKTVEAKRITQKIDDGIKRLEVSPRTKQKMLIVFGNNIDLSKNIYVAGNNLYFAELITKSGFENAVKRDKATQPILGLEGIIGCNPDIVVVLFPYTKEKKITTAQIKAAWSALPINAAKRGSIFVLEEDYISIPSDRITLFLEDLRKIVEAHHANLR